MGCSYLLVKKSASKCAQMTWPEVPLYYRRTKS